MPSGKYNPNASDYSKVQGGEIGADGSLRKIVKIGAVSSGVTMNVSGTLEASFPDTITVEGSVSISNTPTVEVSGTVDVSNIHTVTVGGTVGISGTPTVEVSNTPSVSVANTVTVDGVINAELITQNKGLYAVTLLSFSAASGSETVISAPGGGTSIKILALMIGNENTDSGRRFEFRFGSTPFVRGYVGPELPINWNMVAHQPLSDTNTAVNVWANGTIVAPVTVHYTKV